MFPDAFVLTDNNNKTSNDTANNSNRTLNYYCQYKVDVMTATNNSDSDNCKQ